MSIAVVRTDARRVMATTRVTRCARRDDGHQGRAGWSGDEVVEVVSEYLAEDGSVDDADLARGSVSEGVGGEAVDVAEATGRGFVEDGAAPVGQRAQAGRRGRW